LASAPAPAAVPARFSVADVNTSVEAAPLSITCARFQGCGGGAGDGGAGRQAGWIALPCAPRRRHR
jgi:hypothetical protein